MAGPIDRPDLYVVARILDALWQSATPMKKTPLQQAAGINYTMFGRYLAYLAGRELLAVRSDADGVEWIEITPKGSDALRFLTAGISRVFGHSSASDPEGGASRPAVGAIGSRSGPTLQPPGDTN